MLIGENVLRADGPAKVTGQALYVDDVRPEGCLYGATVRAPCARGRFLGSLDCADTLRKLIKARG